MRPALFRTSRPVYPALRPVPLLPPLLPAGKSGPGTPAAAPYRAPAVWPFHSPNCPRSVGSFPVYARSRASTRWPALSVPSRAVPSGSAGSGSPPSSRL